MNKGKMKQVVLAFLFGPILLLTARAASFECDKASTRIEKLICGDDELSILDETLSTAYLQAMERSEDKQHSVEEQKLWLKKIRNACQDVTCLKNSYMARSNEMNERLKQPAYVQSSYFIETPVRSIDKMMDGCFADVKCAAQAEVFIPAYSKQSNIPEIELRSILKDCLAGQQTMNACAGYEQFVIRNEMSETLREATRDVTSSCKKSVIQHQAAWEKKIWNKCSKDADAEIGEGSAWGGEVMSCNSEALKDRIRAFQRAGSCLPCSKCIQLP